MVPAPSSVRTIYSHAFVMNFSRNPFLAHQRANGALAKGYVLHTAQCYLTSPLLREHLAIRPLKVLHTIVHLQHSQLQKSESGKVAAATFD